MTRAPERLLTIAQAAELASYDEATILGWIARGLPHVAPGGRRRPRHSDIRIKESVLWAWIDSLSRECKPAAEKPKGPRQTKAAPAGAGGLSAWRETRRGREAKGAK